MKYTNCLECICHVLPDLCVKESKEQANKIIDLNIALNKLTTCGP